MSEQPQTIVQPVPSTDKPLGARNEANLQSAFATSPIYSGEMTDDNIKEYFQDNVMDATILNGLGLNSFNTEYADAPDLEEVETGGAGAPATPYVPNPSSPGVGSVSPSDQPAFEGSIPESGPEYGSGLGGTESPSSTSPSISSQKLGEYISGRSYQGSDGRS